MFSDSSVSLVKVNLEVKSGLMLYFHLYNYAIQNNLVSESYDATWNCPKHNLSVIHYFQLEYMLKLIHLEQVLSLVMKYWAKTENMYTLKCCQLLNI